METDIPLKEDGEGGPFPQQRAPRDISKFPDRNEKSQGGSLKRREKNKLIATVSKEIASSER